jgi:PAS domain S-box-containing protein
MAEDKEKKTLQSARDKFLGYSLESSRKSYFPLLQQKLEEAKSNEKRLQLLIDNLPARISYVNTEEKFVLINRAYEKIFRKSKEDIVGSSLHDIMGEENYASLKPYIDKVLGGEETHFETAITPYPGETLWNEINYIPIFDNSGKVVGFYVLARDLTDRKKAEEERRMLEA